MFSSIIEYYKGIFEGQGTWYIVGQVLGLLLVVLNFFIFIQKNRSRIITVKATADGLSAIQNILIGTYTGAALTFVALVRDIIFYFRGTKKWADHIVWLFIFMVAMLVSPILTWAGIISLFPAVGSCFAVYGFFSKNTLVIKCCNLVGSTLWVIYQIITANIGGAIGSIIAIVSVIIGIIKELKQRKQPK